MVSAMNRLEIVVAQVVLNGPWHRLVDLQLEAILLAFHELERQFLTRVDAHTSTPHVSLSLVRKSHTVIKARRYADNLSLISILSQIHVKFNLSRLLDKIHFVVIYAQLAMTVAAPGKHLTGHCEQP